MAEIENVVIYKVDTDQPVRSINDLKKNIETLKEKLGDLAVGTMEYAMRLKELQENQAALKNAMHATTASSNDEAKAFERTAKEAKGLGDSYNSLVRQMAKLDQAFRSTENPEVRRRLGQQIKDINDQLKKLDEARGKYGRNVGNYKSALDGLSKSFKATAGSAAGLIAPIAGVTGGLKALSATPVIGILGLLANALNVVVKGMNSSYETTKEWNRALAAFAPIGNAAKKVVADLGAALAKTATWVVDLLEKWGLLTEKMQNSRDLESESQEIREMARRNMVANAELEADAQRLRDMAAMKDKYTAEQRLKFLKDAALDEKAIVKNNLALAELRVFHQQKINEEHEAQNRLTEEDLEALAQAQAEYSKAQAAHWQTMRRLDTNIAATTKEMGRNVKVTEEQIQMLAVSLEELDLVIDKTLARRVKLEKAQEEWNNLLNVDISGVLKEQDDAFAEVTADIDNMLDEQVQAEIDAYNEERRLIQGRADLFTGFASVLSQISGSIADIYEADAEMDEKAAAKSKALRVASAIISTLGGAVSAFTSTWFAEEIPMSVKMVLAPLNASAVLAAGYAQIKQMNAVKVGGNSASAAVPAPTFPVDIQQVRTITGASEEDRLNRMASDTRVYVLESDITRAQNTRKVRVAEASW